MKHKCTCALRVLALLLAVLICLPFFVACKKDAAMTGAPTLEIDEKGKMTFSLLLDAETLQAHAGQTAYLYELLPGETVYSINSKPSMQRSKVSSKIKFSFDVTDENGADRRCNSYLLTFSDGTIFSKPITLSNPELMAKNTEEFPRANTIKGLNAYDEDLASSLHSAHTLISLSTEELLAGDTSLSWNGIGVSLNGTFMTQTDAKVLAAVRAGMQISIELIIGENASVSQVSALMNILLDRYSDKESGEVTALILKESEIADAEEAEYGVSVSRMATLMRVARLSMISRVANGKVYLGVDTTLDATQAYAKAVYDQAKATEAISFGVALYPDPTTEALLPKAEADEDTAEDRNLILSDVAKVVKSLTDHMGRSTDIAILGVEIPAVDSQLQSALYAYAYRMAVLAKADLLIYSSLVGEEAGLYDADGVARPVADCFALVDTDQNLAAEADAADLLGKEWTSLKSIRTVRVEMSELANVGAIEKTTERFVGFSEGDTQGFTSFGLATVPTITQSESWQTPVLATTISEPYYNIASGLRWSFSDVKKLKDVHVLSANLLIQSAEQENVEVFLSLEGTSQDGRALSLSSSVKVTPDMWQAVSFHIRGFTVQMDADKPCTMTLTVKRVGNLPEEGTMTHTLLLHSINVNRAEKDHSMLLLAGMIAGGFAIGASVILLASRKRKREGYDGR